MQVCCIFFGKNNRKLNCQNCILKRLLNLDFKHLKKLGDANKKVFNYSSCKLTDNYKTVM